MSDMGSMPNLDDGSEAAIQQRITDLEAEIERLKAQIVAAREARKIMFYSGDELKMETIRFFSEMLGCPAQRADDVGDFWLVAEAVGEAWCFGEVAESENGNASKDLLAQLIINRAKAGKSDDYPAILVVNTYFGKESTEDRDQAIPEDIRRRAAEDNILVVRTLDLVRLKQKEDSGFPGIKEFLESIRAGGGWYEVNETLSSKVHTS